MADISTAHIPGPPVLFGAVTGAALFAAAEALSSPWWVPLACSAVGAITPIGITWLKGRFDRRMRELKDRLATRVAELEHERHMRNEADRKRSELAEKLRHTQAMLDEARRARQD